MKSDLNTTNSCIQNSIQSNIYFLSNKIDNINAENKRIFDFDTRLNTKVHGTRKLKVLLEGTTHLISTNSNHIAHVDEGVKFSAKDISEL